MQKLFNQEFTVYVALFRFVAEDSLEEAIVDSDGGYSVHI